MKIAGIIAEYNPLHNGHAYHIKTTREMTEADYIIVALSGDFIQRGEPACLSKHHRAHMALLAGADLVFELPSTHSCQSAELFARSGIELFEGLGCVDYVSFGSEAGDISSFQELGNFLANEPMEYQQELKRYLKTGLSYPAARQKALASYTNLDETFLASPNNILGLEYCKAIRRLNSSIQPITIARAGNGYHELQLSDQYPSASGIRHHFQKHTAITQLQDSFPENVFAYIMNQNIMNEFLTSEDFSLILRWFLYANTVELSKFMDLSPELSQRIQRERNNYENFSQFISRLKTKDITHSRLTRAIFHALLNIRDCPPLPYARLLGFQKSASPALKLMKKKGQLPLLTKLADAPSLLNSSAQQVLEDNTRISNLYESVLCEKTNKKFIHEYQKEIILLP